MISLPSDEILLKYASGTLDLALRLLLEKHFALRPEARRRLDDFNAFGGVMLAAEAGAPMTAGSLDRALARLGAAQPQPLAAPEWPPVETLRWRWAGPGRGIANIDIPGSFLKAYAIRIAPGKAMLQHSHVDQEWTLIAQGSYRDENGEYHAGSFIEEDASTLHAPVATGDIDCICLAVMSGPLAAAGVGGRIARWMMR